MTHYIRYIKDCCSEVDSSLNTNKTICWFVCYGSQSQLLQRLHSSPKEKKLQPRSERNRTEQPHRLMWDMPANHPALGGGGVGPAACPRWRNNPDQCQRCRIPDWEQLQSYSGVHNPPIGTQFQWIGTLSHRAHTRRCCQDVGGPADFKQMLWTTYSRLSEVFTGYPYVA